jgi:hypothetical protein
MPFEGVDRLDTQRSREDDDLSPEESNEPETKESLYNDLKAIEESQKYPGSHPEYAHKSMEELDTKVKEIEQKIYQIEYGALKSKIDPIKAEIDSINEAEAGPYQDGPARVIDRGMVEKDIHRTREEDVAKLEQEIYELEDALRKHPGAAPAPEQASVDTDPAVVLKEPEPAPEAQVAETAPEPAIETSEDPAEEKKRKAEELEAYFKKNKIPKQVGKMQKKWGKQELKDFRKELKKNQPHRRLFRFLGKKLRR